MIFKVYSNFGQIRISLITSNSSSIPTKYIHHRHPSHFLILPFQLCHTQIYFQSIFKTQYCSRRQWGDKWGREFLRAKAADALQRISSPAYTIPTAQYFLHMALGMRSCREWHQASCHYLWNGLIKAALKNFYWETAEYFTWQSPTPNVEQYWILIIFIK